MLPKGSSQPKKAKRIIKAPYNFASVAESLECDDDKTRFEAKQGGLAKASSKKQ